MNVKNETAISQVDIRDAFFEEVYSIASKDSDVMFLTADMGAFSLKKLKENFKKQYVNLGVAEQNLVSVGAGLTLGGKKVFLYAIAAFMTQRCFEQIKIDLCYMDLPVVIIGAGPGITYSTDGPTHYAVEDIAIMRSLPNIVIFNPSDSTMAKAAAGIAYKSKKPFYVRIDRGNYPLLYKSGYDFSGGVELLKEGRDLLIISTGAMVHRAIEVARRLKDYSIDAGVVDLYRIKPLNKERLLSFIDKTSRLVTLEEHTLSGGIGSIVSELLADSNRHISFKRFGLCPQDYRGWGSREWMRKSQGLDVEGLCEAIRK
ncbi:MAG: transketolase C-terminal domain-containing protein [Candidatus Omnitrophica bacterium]|nr:transketolase C-terminal domain-containing protein [Candidatus Omnitrophota bacterium]MDD5430404.1 transketolase C-terminal domain-containing protein [Candidatus Omnitrophota bacterium]